MNVQEALNVFGLSGEVTEEIVKKAFKKLANKFHPDKNADDKKAVAAEMMKMINVAHAFLIANIDRINQYQSTNSDDHYNYSEEFEAVLNALCAMGGVLYEVIGNWCWISGDTKPHKDALKALGCKWAPKKAQWFYRPEEHKSIGNRRENSIDEIREKYGSNGQRKSYGQRTLEARA